MELPYYHIPTQLCQAWKINLSQLQHIASKYHMQISVYLGDRNPIIKEISLQPISDIDLIRLSNTPIKKLIVQGFRTKKISQVILKKATYEIIERTYLFSNKTTSFINIYHHEFPKNSRIKTATGTRLPGDASVEIPNDGFIEINDSSFINSSISIKDIFSQPKLDIFQVKCNKEGHARYLDRIYTITIEDAYTSHDEKIRIEKILKIEKIKHTFSNEPIKERDNRYQERTQNLLSINPDLSKENIAKQIYLEEVNYKNDPPSPERIAKIIRTNIPIKNDG